MTLPQRQDPSTGRFLKLDEGLRLAVSELADENTELMRDNLKLRQQAEAAQAEAHTTRNSQQRRSCASTWRRSTTASPSWVSRVCS